MITIRSKSRVLTWENVQTWGEAVDGAALLDELREVFRRYVVLPKWGPEMLALWTVHTYAWQLREVTTYVGVSSPEKRCGKTTLLGVLTEVVNRPLAAANISPPALFRVIEEAEPTLLIDEADTFLQGKEEMRGILNAGYSRKTAYVVRVGGEKLNRLNELNEDGSTETPHATRLQRFSCWCPKAMAAIGRLPETLADRCIVLTMQRKSPREQCERLKGLSGTVLRQKCARFVMDHAEAISAAKPQAPVGVNDRATDIWEPLLALADLAGGEWPRLARDAAVGLSARIGDSDTIGQLLIHIWAEFIEGDATRMFSRDLVEGLNAYRERPWAEGLKGQMIDEVWLARRLRRYGVRSRTMWIDGVAAKGYLKEDLNELFGRYITIEDVEEVREEGEGAGSGHR